MLKVVLDTSILVSAFLKHTGVNARILQNGKDKYHLYLSEEILKETQGVLLGYKRIREKYQYSDDEAWEYLKALRLAAWQVIAEAPKIRVVEKDPKDDIILACALKAKVDYLVSKDDHLKDLKEYKGIKIVSSQEFLEILAYSL